MVYFCMFFNNKEYKDKVMESYVIHRALARGEISSEDYKTGDFFKQVCYLLVLQRAPGIQVS